MSTAADTIKRAMRLIGVLGAGATPSDEDYEDGLTALNGMLGSWNNDGLMCYATQTESLSLADGDSTYTIGPAGDLNTTRPVAVEAAWILEDNISYPVTIISDAQYDAIQNKTTESSWPNVANYRATMATGTLYVYPVPNAVRTMKLRTRVVLESFDAVTDAVSLPPGWEDALAFNLAIRIAPEFEVAVRPEVIAVARETKAGIKNANVRPIEAVSELGLLFGHGSSNIESDGA